MFQVRINNIDFSLNRNYLVDRRIDDRCVLRIRPFSPETVFVTPDLYCRAMCLGPVCDHLEGLSYDFVALGLPFLHRFCVYFAAGVKSSRVFIAQQKRIIDGICAYHAYVTPAYKEPPGPPFPGPTTPGARAISKYRGSFPYREIS